MSRSRSTRPAAGLVACLLASLCACSTMTPMPQCSSRTMEAEVAGQRLSYLVSVPEQSTPPSEGWPLLLFLHGVGECGEDLELVRVHGPPNLVGQIPELSRCVLISPQCPADSWWRAETLAALLDEVRSQAHVDSSRIYVTGLSMGGYGTWSLLAHSPELFAAAVPICGGGDTTRLWSDIPSDFRLEGLLAAKDVPLRVFHGEEDGVVPVQESRLLVRALEQAGAEVELTVYPGVGHDSWSQTYADPGLYAWLFAQRRED
jgi:predicted peptidase